MRTGFYTVLHKTISNTERRHWFIRERAYKWAAAASAIKLVPKA